MVNCKVFCSICNTLNVITSLDILENEVEKCEGYFSNGKKCDYEFDMEEFEYLFDPEDDWDF